AGDVAAGPSEAGGKPSRDRIALKVERDDRNSACRTLGGSGGARSRRDDDVDPALDQLGGEDREPLCPFLRPAIRDGDVLVFDVAEFRQAVPQSLDEVCDGADASGKEPDLRGLHRLRFAGGRGGQKTTDQRAYEASPVHYWITSSARASTAGGMVSPSV